MTQYVRRYKIKIMKKRQAILWCVAALIINTILLIFGLIWSRTAFTFLEYEEVKIDATSDSSQTTDSKNAEYIINSPYDTLNSLTFTLKQQAEHDNSIYNLAIFDEEKLLTKQDFVIFFVDENNKIKIDLPTNIAVSKNHNYKIIISPGERSTPADDIFDGQNIIIYGGDYDPLWTVFVCLMAAFVYLLLARIIFLVKKGTPIKKDMLVKVMLVFALVLMLSLVFAPKPLFLIDEKDNIGGGIVIAEGGVLYKDYVTQHTPLTYYICSVFALLGAKSIFQFRIMYYVLVAMIWAFVFKRYGKKFGEKRIVFLSVAYSCLLPFLVETLSQSILSDNIQAISMMILLFEFICFVKEGKNSHIGWARSLIVSLCIFSAVGVAFNSVYPIFGIFIVLVVNEFKFWKGRFDLKKAIARYYKLFVTFIAILCCILLYFILNDTLHEAIRQAYHLNTEIYAKYLGDGFGSNVIAPFILGVQYMAEFIYNNIVAVARLELNHAVILNSAIIILAVYSIATLLTNKKYLIASALIVAICLSFSRGTNFHSISAFLLIIYSGIIFFPKIKHRLPAWQLAPCAILMIMLFVPYIKEVRAFVLYSQPPISPEEKIVIDNTTDGDYIAIDSTIDVSLYYNQKNRKIANRNAYILPWYMNWYEGAVVDDLQKYQPKVIVYNPDVTIWEKYTNFSKDVRAYIESNYTKSKESQNIWLKNI